jgi:hypothetical protein
VQVSP